jgi:hypothetical protein
VSDEVYFWSLKNNMKKLPIFFLSIFIFLACTNKSDEGIEPQDFFGKENLEKVNLEDVEKLKDNLLQLGYKVELNPSLLESNLELPDFKSGKGIVNFLELKKTEKDKQKILDFFKQELKNNHKLLKNKAGLFKGSSSFSDKKELQNSISETKGAQVECANLNRFYSVHGNFTATGNINFGINTNNGINASYFWGLTGFNPFTWYEVGGATTHKYANGDISITVHGYIHIGVRYEGNNIDIVTTRGYRILIGCDGSVHVDQIIA